MAAGVTTLIELEDLRDVAAMALAPATDEDPVVLVDIVDSLTPPALMLRWADPWLEPGSGTGVATMGPCLWTARLQVVCVAGRLEPGPGIRVLEGLVALVVDRLEADAYTWPLDNIGAPTQYDLSAVSYLAAFVNYAVPTTL